MTNIILKSDFDIELIQVMGSDVNIARAARVSTGKDDLPPPALKEDNSERLEYMQKVGGLINYLMANRHGSPFEHNALTFRVSVPIFVLREWHRHRIGVSYNEESARYKTLDPVFYVPPRHRPMFKVDDWKPGRPKFLTIEEEWARLSELPDGETIRVPGGRFDQLVLNLTRSYETSYRAYEANLAMGFDPGLARDCLPVGIYSSQWFTCNARSLMAFLSLRTHEPDARQVSYPLWEIDQASRQMEKIFAEQFPLTYKAFCDNGRVAP